MAIAEPSNAQVHNLRMVGIRFHVRILGSNSSTPCGKTIGVLSSDMAITAITLSMYINTCSSCSLGQENSGLRSTNVWLVSLSNPRDWIPSGPSACAKSSKRFGIHHGLRPRVLPGNPLAYSYFLDIHDLRAF